MIIKNMTASFGKLENARMELSDGLNVIYAPNEAGKSTWCAFIRTMLYGVSTSQREKGGIIPDKKRFMPWGSYSMSGSMDISFQNTDITLSRSGAAGKPMGNCTAVLSGTAQKIPELCGKAPGETLIGVPESVFRRSAFISGAALALDKDSELEKRISALITSGSEEDESFIEASEALHKKQVKLKHNVRVGKISELNARLGEINAALADIEEKNRLLGDDFAELKELDRRCGELESELKRAEAFEARMARKRLCEASAARRRLEGEIKDIEAKLGGVDEKSVELTEGAFRDFREAAAAYSSADEMEKEYAAAKEKAETAEKHLEEVGAEKGNLSAEGIGEARRALFEYESARIASEEREAELSERRRENAEHIETARRSKLGVFAAVAAALAAVSAAAYIPFKAATLLILAAVLAVGAAVLFALGASKNGEARRAVARRDMLARESERELISRAEAAREREKAAASALTEALCAINAETLPERAAARIDEREQVWKSFELARQELEAARRLESGLYPAHEKLGAAWNTLEARYESFRRMMSRLGEELDADIYSAPRINEAAKVIAEKRELLSRLKAAQSALEAAQKLESGLGDGSVETNIDAGYEEDTPPARDRETIRRELDEAAPRRAELKRSLALFEGELRHLGDPVVLETEAEGIRAEIERCEREYAAIELAAEVLNEANFELQTRFAPIVGSRAGELLAEMTDGRYDKISFDRDFRFSASGGGELEREAEYLSSGASAQLYLAARLAVCELTLPSSDKCPIILDDALICFDDERASAALKLLKRLSKERQIILFTCHTREKRLLESMA